MSLKYQRPNTVYAGDTTLANRTKYQTDASAEPKVAISSQKVDGDFNYIIDVLNEIDQASGARASIDDRLSVVMNADGTLKSSVVATVDDWIDVDAEGGFVVNETTVQVEADVTDVIASGQRVRVTLNGEQIYANVHQALYTGSVTQIVCGDIVNRAGDATSFSGTLNAVAYAPLGVGVTGNSQHQFSLLKMRAEDPVFRLKKDGGVEYGLSLDAENLNFVKNVGTEDSPTWAVQGQVSAQGLVVGDHTVTLTKIAEGTPNTYLGFDDTGAPEEKVLPEVISAGCLMPYAGPVVPSGWLLCDGSAVSRTTYAKLFSAIGIVYGDGDGSTSFNLPDLRGRALFGVDDMGGTAASRVTQDVSGIEGATLGATGGDEAVQAHNHTLTDPGHTHTYPLALGQLMNPGGSDASQSPNYGETETSTETTGITLADYGEGDSQNMPPAMMVNWMIKS